MLNKQATLRPLSRKLTDTQVKKAKPKDDGRPKNLGDGGGLYLHIKPNGKRVGKFWRYNYRVDGKMKTLSIGIYPEISLKLARELHDEARALLARGVDPSIYKKELQATSAAEEQNIFEAVAREWFIKHLASKSPTHIERTTSYLERDVFPFIGKRPIADIKPRELIPLVERIQKRITHDTHLRVLGTIGQICRYSFSH